MPEEIDTLTVGGICKHCLNMTLVDENGECLRCRRSPRPSAAVNYERYL